MLPASALGTVPPGIVVLPSPHGCHPGAGQALRISSAFCPQVLGQHCFRPQVSHNQSQTVYSGLLTHISLEVAQNSSTGLAKGQPLLHPSLRFSYLSIFSSRHQHIPFSIGTSQKLFCKSALANRRLRGHQPPGATVSRGWYGLSREEPWAQGWQSKVKHHIFPNYSVMWEKSWELVGPRFGVCAIEWVLPIKVP